MNELGSIRLLNESAVRDFALRCSAQCRAGRFTRIGQDFIEEVKADVEAMVRALDNAGGSTEPHDPINCEDFGFTTGVLSDKVMGKWNRVIGKIIQKKIWRQPSTGCTARATR